MNLRIILSTFALAICIAVNAQGPAAQVKEIQKNTTTYINAESTDPSEDAAYGNAMRQMIDMARNFVNTNNKGADISDEAIKSVVKKIVIPRGEFKRVFLYAKRDNLIGKSGNNNSNDSQPVAEVKKPENTVIKAEEKEETAQPTVNDGKSKSEQQQDTSSDLNEIKDTKEFEQSLPKEIVADVQESANVPSATKELIGLLQGCKSLHEAASILYKYKNRRIVSDYGVSKQSHNSMASYWVVEDSGNITVLGPEIKGHRTNFRTGKVDALHRYERGVWFRKR